MRRQKYDGITNCGKGFKCVRKNVWYSQCRRRNSRAKEFEPWGQCGAAIQCLSSHIIMWCKIRLTVESKHAYKERFDSIVMLPQRPMKGAGLQVGRTLSPGDKRCPWRQECRETLDEYGEVNVFFSQVRLTTASQSTVSCRSTDGCFKKQLFPRSSTFPEVEPQSALSTPVII